MIIGSNTSVDTDSANLRVTMNDLILAQSCLSRGSTTEQSKPQQANAPQLPHVNGAVPHNNTISHQAAPGASIACDSNATEKSEAPMYVTLVGVSFGGLYLYTIHIDVLYMIE